MSPRIIAVANQKGGVGKTTTTINLSAALADLGRRVLVIDCDPQANATSGLGVARSDDLPTVYDVLLGGRPLEEIRLPTMVDGLSLVPSGIPLAGAEIELVDLERRESRLMHAISAAPLDVDYVFLDCPPSLGMLTVNAVVAAHSLLIPLQCEYYALEGLGLLTHTIGLLRRQMNPHLAIDGIVLTLYDPRLTLAAQVVDEVRSRFPKEALDSVIPRNVRLSEAPSHGMPINRYDPTCKGALAYRLLALELDRRLCAMAHLNAPAARATRPALRPTAAFTAVGEAQG